MMTHTERLHRLLAGRPVDRPLYAAWGHVMNLSDRNAKDFAKATIDFQNANEFDFIKIMSNPYYLIEDTGIVLRPPAHYADSISRCSNSLPIKKAEDWERLSYPEVGKGALAREQDAIRRVVDHYQGDVPVIATIFTPMMWLSYLAIPSEQMDVAEQTEGSTVRLLERYLTKNERLAGQALERLAQINQEYMSALLEEGVSGFFYCTEYARSEWSDRALFDQFERQYDLKTLNAVHKKSEFNILHVCGNHALAMDWVLDYPVEAINWDDQRSKNPSLGEVREKTDKILVGGLDRLHDFSGVDREMIKTTLQKKILEAQKQAGQKLIISGGCDWKLDATYRFYIWQEVIEELSAR